MPQRTGIRRPRRRGLGGVEPRSLEHRGRQPQPRRRLLAQRLLRHGRSRRRGHVRRRACGRPRRRGRRGKRRQVVRPALAGVLLERRRGRNGVLRLLGLRGLERPSLVRGRPVRTRHRAVRELVGPRPFDARARASAGRRRPRAAAGRRSSPAPRLRRRPRPAPSCSRDRRGRSPTPRSRSTFCAPPASPCSTTARAGSHRVSIFPRP